MKVTKLQVYGDEAEGIKQGEVFTATVRSVEGRKVVELLKQKQESPSNCNNQNIKPQSGETPAVNNVKTTQITIDVPEEHFQVMQIFALLTEQKVEEYAAEALVELMVQDADRFFDNVDDEHKEAARVGVLKKLGREDRI